MPSRSLTKAARALAVAEKIPYTLALRRSREARAQEPRRLIEVESDGATAPISPQVPFRIETPADYRAWDGRFDLNLIHLDGRDSPALVWMDEHGGLHGIRPVSEDDGRWVDLPQAVRETLAVPETGLPDEFVDQDEGMDDQIAFTAFTVLYSPSGRPSTGSRDHAGGSAA